MMSVVYLSSPSDSGRIRCLRKFVLRCWPRRVQWPGWSGRIWYIQAVNLAGCFPTSLYYGRFYVCGFSQAICMYAVDCVVHACGAYGPSAAGLPPRSLTRSSSDELSYGSLSHYRFSSLSSRTAIPLSPSYTNVATPSSLLTVTLSLFGQHSLGLGPIEQPLTTSIVSRRITSPNPRVFILSTTLLRPTHITKSLAPFASPSYGIINTP